ncbi:thiamine pyrophosphate-dependent dehydrogenase E1 component subunit alpha [Acidobacteriota bacterium]
MKPNLWKLYRQMLKSRIFEEKVIELWEKGSIFGEMHTGIGEEAIIAGTIDHLIEGDAIALDHRGTPPLIMRGVDIAALLHEFLGNWEGLCCGFGGHMHLFSREYMTASSGIVGASGPLGSGFALALQHLYPGKLALAFFGEGALNQGMLMESFNLASTWKLPVLFVCKDNSLAITTNSSSVTGGTIHDRIKGFGIPLVDVDGSDIEAVWEVGFDTTKYIREGNGPYFIHARCAHLEGHFLGDPLLSITRDSLSQVKQRSGALLKSVAMGKGASFPEKLKGMKKISALAAKAAKQSRKIHDPVALTRKSLSGERIMLLKLEEEVKTEIEERINEVLNKQKENLQS